MNKNTGLKVPITEKMERDFIASVAKDIKRNTAVKSMVIDALNCSKGCVDELRRISEMYNDSGKKIFILE